MSAGLKGNIFSLAQFSADLRRMASQRTANAIAAAAAPVLTSLVKSTFAASEDAFGGSWKIKADGTRATLRKSGDLAKYIAYKAIGTKLRLALGVRYAKYQIGTRPVAPKQGQGLPVEYTRALKRVAVDECRKALGR